MKRKLAWLMALVVVMLTFSTAVLAAAAPPTITTQPTAKTAASGTTVKFSIKASGTNLTYQWQFKKVNGSWTNSSAVSGKTATLSVSVKPALQGCSYRCVVKNAGGKVISKAVQLTVSPCVTVQPAAASAADGTVATFAVKATGTGLTYQWQMQKVGATTWSNSPTVSAKTATFYVSAKADNDGRSYRCVIKDSAGRTATTNAAKLTVSPCITAQPKAVTAADGTTAKFTVKATGTGLTYQWQIQKAGATAWLDSTAASAKTATFSVSAKMANDGRSYRCVIKDSAGRTSTTSAVKLTVKLPNVALNKTNFPNAAFRSYLKKNFDKDGNGILSNAERKAVTKINVSNSDCANLKGIEYFPCLTELNCDGCGLKSLDISKNTLLKVLTCDYNKLTSLNVTKNTALTQLTCEANELSSLDISKNTALKDLCCDSNNLKKLDVSKNKKLMDLSCFSNNLTSLDLSTCASLKWLMCSDNNLTGLDLSKNTVLKELYCTGCGLTSLNLSKNTSLKSLECSSNKLTSLNLSKNVKLTWVDCYKNSLTSLNVSGCTKLDYLDCCDNRLTSLNVSGCTVLRELLCARNRLTGVNVSGCKALEYLYCDENNLTSLNVGDCTALSEMRCADNALTKLNVSKNTELVWLTCYNNSLTALDLSNNKAMYKLHCDKGVKVTGCTGNVEFEP